MNETFSQVFRLLRNALFPDAEEPLEYLDNWTAVFEEMQAQTVAALPYLWLKDQKELNKRAEYATWLIYCFQTQAQWGRVMHGQSQLLALLQENQIDCVILKGAAAGMAYPHPPLRSMGDVDFLVKRCDRDRAARVLEENGYCLKQKDGKYHHYEYSKNGIVYELHWRLSLINESNERLLSLFEEGIANREIRNIGTFSFPVLPAALNGLVLVFHINDHLRSGLGLRQIIDWMMYVNQLPDNVWNEKLRPLLRETGKEKLALYVTAMCQRYLGLSKELDGCETVDIKLCNELMGFIMKMGNFGRKSEATTGKVAFVYRDLSNPIRVLKRLQEGGLYRWNAAKEHAILRPFAWIYQICSIIRELKRSGISIKTLLYQRKQGIWRRKMFNELGLQGHDGTQSTGELFRN